MNTLLRILLSSTQPTKLFSVLVCLLAATGMVLRHDSDDDIALLLALAPHWVWALLLAYIAISRLCGLFFWPGNVLTQFLTPVLAIVTWAFFFAAQLHDPAFGLGLLFIVPLVQETWLLGRVIFDARSHA